MTEQADAIKQLREELDNQFTDKGRCHFLLDMLIQTNDTLGQVIAYSQGNFQNMDQALKLIAIKLSEHEVKLNGKSNLEENREPGDGDPPASGESEATGASE